MSTADTKVYLQQWLWDNENLVNQNAKEVYGMVYDPYIKSTNKDANGNIISFELTDEGKKKLPDLNREFLPAFNQFIKKDAEYKLERVDTKALEWARLSWDKKKAEKPPIVLTDGVETIDRKYGKVNVPFKNKVEIPRSTEGMNGSITITSEFNPKDGNFVQKKAGTKNVKVLGRMDVVVNGNSYPVAKVQEYDPIEKTYSGNEYWIPEADAGQFINNYFYDRGVVKQNSEGRNVPVSTESVPQYTEGVFKTGGTQTQTTTTAPATTGKKKIANF